MNPSIRNRLLVVLMSATLIVWVFAAVKSYRDTRSEVQELFDAHLAQSARALLALSAHELPEQLAYLAQKSEEHHVPEMVTADAHKYEQRVAFQIWIGGDYLAVRSENAPQHPFSESVNTFTDRFINGQAWRVYALWNPDKTMQIQVGERYDRRNQLSGDIALHILTSMLLILPVLGLLIWFGVGRAMAPLRRLAKEMRSRELDNLQPVATEKIPLEATPLIDALNALFQRLTVAFENIRRFTADAAHELRTPLAALKTHAQVALGATDEQSRKEALSQVIKGVDRSTHLVDQLLTLARLDPEAHKVMDQQTDLYIVVEEKMAELAPQALGKQVELSLTDAKHTHVRGNDAMLAVLVRNLVENAIRYTPERGRVDVAIAQGDQNVTLTLSDSGCGIPAEERDEVFKRFYRGNSTSAPGTGLGLSIVQRIAEIHHAQITLGESEYHGLKVNVVFQSAESKNDSVQDEALEKKQKNAASF